MVDVFEGSFIDVAKRLGSYCGNLTEMLPIIKTTGNVMTVNFISDEYNHFGGFKALVTIFYCIVYYIKHFRFLVEEEYGT